MTSLQQFLSLVRAARVTGLLALVLMFSGTTLAAGGASCSVMNIPPPGGDPGSPPPIITLTTFIPDAGCWYKSTIELLADAGAFEMTASLARYLVVILFGVYGLAAITDMKARGQLIKMTIATVMVGSLLMTPASRDNTTSYIRVFMLDSWPKVYSTSATWAQSKLMATPGSPDSLGTYVKNLVQEMATMTYNASVFDRVKGQINAALASDGLGSSSAEIRANVIRILEEDRQKGPGDIGNLSMWTTIGSFLVMGLFTVFAAVIYSTAINLILSALLLPVQIAFIAVLQWGYFTKSMIGYVSSLLTTVLVSVFAVGIMKIAIGAPATVMTTSLKDANTLMATQITKYAEEWRKCQWYELGCSLTNVSLDLGVQASSIRSMVVTMGLVLLMSVVASGIAMNQLRRIPALIAGSIGLSGGGESSGTESNPIGAIGEKALAAGGALKMISAAGRIGRTSAAQKSPGAKPGAANGSGVGGAGGTGGAEKGSADAGGGESSAGASGGEGASEVGGASASGASAGGAGAGGSDARMPNLPPEAGAAAQGKDAPKPSIAERVGMAVANRPTGQEARKALMTRSVEGAKALALHHPADRALYDKAMAKGGATAAAAIADAAQTIKEQGVSQGMKTIGSQVATTARDTAAAVQLGNAARSQRDQEQKAAPKNTEVAKAESQWKELAEAQGFNTSSGGNAATTGSASAGSGATGAATGTGTAASAATTGPNVSKSPAGSGTSGGPTATTAPTAPVTGSAGGAANTGTPSSGTRDRQSAPVTTVNSDRPAPPRAPGLNQPAAQTAPQATGSAATGSAAAGATGGSATTASTNATGSGGNGSATAGATTSRAATNASAVGAATGSSGGSSAATNAKTSSQTAAVNSSTTSGQEARDSGSNQASSGDRSGGFGSGPYNGPEPKPAPQTNTDSGSAGSDSTGPAQASGAATETSTASVNASASPASAPPATRPLLRGGSENRAGRLSSSGGKVVAPDSPKAITPPAAPAKRAAPTSGTEAVNAKPVPSLSAAPPPPKPSAPPATPAAAPKSVTTMTPTPKAAPASGSYAKQNAAPAPDRMNAANPSQLTSQKPTVKAPERPQLSVPPKAPTPPAPPAPTSLSAYKSSASSSGSDVSSGPSGRMSVEQARNLPPTTNPSVKLPSESTIGETPAHD